MRRNCRGGENSVWECRHPSGRVMPDFPSLGSVGVPLTGVARQRSPRENPLDRPTQPPFEDQRNPSTSLIHRCGIPSAPGEWRVHPPEIEPTTGAHFPVCHPSFRTIERWPTTKPCADGFQSPSGPWMQLGPSIQPIRPVGRQRPTEAEDPLHRRPPGETPDLMQPMT